MVLAGIFVIGRRGGRYDSTEASSQNLRGTRLCSVAFEWPNLNGVDFSGADLSNARLHAADLRNSVLAEARLSHTHLADARFDGANLWRTQLDGADLNGACFQDAGLAEADLRGADLSTALGFRQEEYAKAVVDEYTKPPANCVPEAALEPADVLPCRSFLARVLAVDT